MNFTKHRAIVKELFNPDPKTIYFDALEQNSKDDLQGYTDRKFKSKAKAVKRKYIIKTEAFTGFADRSNTPIYVGDFLEYEFDNDGMQDIAKNKVGYRNGFFMVDTGYTQGEFNKTEPLYHYLRDNKALVVREAVNV